MKWTEPKKINTSFDTANNYRKEEQNKNSEEEKNISIKNSAIELKQKIDCNVSLDQSSCINSINEKNINEFTLKNKENISIFSVFGGETQHSEYSKLEAYKIELENILGDYVFASLYRKIDNLV